MIAQHLILMSLVFVRWSEYRVCVFVSSKRADANFQATLNLVANANVSGLSRNETYATYINIYNLFAIAMVIHNPCSKSAFG